MKEFLQKSTKIVIVISSWLALIGAIFTIVGLISKSLKSLNIQIFPFIIENFLLIWGTTISLIIILLALQLLKLNRKFTKGFKSNFRKDLDEEWDYIGDWKKQEKGILMVTNSNPGGILKKGALWENYTLTFETKIINKCLGVIIRAQDLDNYYMMQIQKNQISPHRRTTILQIPDKKPENIKTEIDLFDIDYKAGWKVFKEKITIHNLNLNDWFKMKIIVSGQSIKIYINNQLVLHENTFLQIPVGKIGFRNHKEEKALIKNIKVELNN